MAYAFNPAPEAKAALKERFVWMLFMGFLFFLLYGSANQYARLGAPHPSLYMAWEQKIPFVEAFIVPYMSSDVLFCIAFLMPYSRFELRVLAARVLFIITVSVACFALFPLQFGFEKPDIGTFHLLFGMLEADLPYNQAPSLHIGFALVLWASMRKYLRNPVIKGVLAIWFWLVALSTLLVYQHHFIDLPTGAAVGLASLSVVPSNKESFLTKGFTTPRSLKMGLYYLVGAAVCLVGAFYAGIAAGLLLWIAVSLLAVSIVYAFGQAIVRGRTGAVSLLQWILFFPYFAGNYLSWRYYKRKLPLLNHVRDHVFIGRYPAGDEYEGLQSHGIERTIDLAAEQPFHKERMSRQQFPLLDQTIQSPEALHRVVEAIHSDKRPVHVHCALGLSRSVLAVSAWLMSLGYSYEEADAVMVSVWPGSVRSPYMRITLEMYAEYLSRSRCEGVKSKAPV
ncbi:dual specificity protein phosphatase family protein [uncultured Desulfuromonas sp.]|uniref:dual specificity protein phosphatase family protein n=1 Tax=uncultured Desulfuromonas sp. TaxID=181013 RepID=UPI002AAAB61D|nr:dual specificity protein phosphatase family protein [uncultured Desulfuromonas sp.]